MQRIFAELAIIENRSNKKALSKCSGLLISGGTDGTRTRDPCVTGRYSNRLNYRSTEFLRFITTGCHPGLLQFDARQFPTLTWGDPTLPSALRRFTSEFGMGSGGTTALVPPANSLCSSCVFCAHTALAALASVSHILMYAPFIASFAALSQRKILRTLNQS